MELCAHVDADVREAAVKSFRPLPCYRDPQGVFLVLWPPNAEGTVLFISLLPPPVPNNQHLVRRIREETDPSIKWTIERFIWRCENIDPAIQFQILLEQVKVQLNTTTLHLLWRRKLTNPSPFKCLCRKDVCLVLRKWDLDLRIRRAT
jgi:hypothetical protein